MGDEAKAKAEEWRDFDFGALRVDRDLSRDGVWKRYGDTKVWFLIAHMQTPAYYRELAKAATGIDASLPEDEREDLATMRATARALLKGWRTDGLGDVVLVDGKAVPFSPEAAEGLFKMAYPAYLFVASVAASTSHFAETEAADTKGCAAS
jgi:hypothetical protein